MYFDNFFTFLSLSLSSPFLFFDIRYKCRSHATPVKYLFPVCNFYGRLLKETKSFSLRQLDSCLMAKDTLQKWYYLSTGVFLKTREVTQKSIETIADLSYLFACSLLWNKLNLRSLFVQIITILWFTNSRKLWECIYFVMRFKLPFSHYIYI